MATISDVRRGDRFTWGGITYLAMDDCRPVDFFLTGEIAYGGIIYIRAAGLKRNPEGVYDIDMRIPSASVVRLNYPIDIHERGVRVHHISDDVRDSTPLSQIVSVLDGIMASRKTARREADDLDEQRDIMIRKALAARVPVADLVTKTGLTRARIYQIRDNRR